MRSSSRSLNLILLTVIHSLLSICIRTVAAQAIQDDSIVYTTLGGWGDMRACARCPFQVNFGICGVGDFLNDAVGCMTNACLCRPSTLEEAVEFIDERVISLCSNYDDQSTATDFLLRYCSTHGYTLVGTPATPTVSSKTTTSQTSLHTTQEPTTSPEAQPSPTPNPSPSLTISDPLPSTTDTSTNSITSNPSPTSSTNPPAMSNSDDNSIKTSDIVGIVVGILGLFVAILTLWISWKKARPAKLWQGVSSRRDIIQLRQV